MTSRSRRIRPVRAMLGNGRHGPTPRRRLPPLSVLPTLVTLGNLVAGFAAIFYAAQPPEFAGPWGWSGLTLASSLVVLGLILDGVDGALARLTRSTSDIGGQLDSFADAVTFGIAPAFMTLCLVGNYLQEDSGLTILGPHADSVLGKVIWSAAAVYVCCAALRLARFNVEVGRSELKNQLFFRGLPSPGAAGTVTSLILLHQHLLQEFGSEIPRSFARGAALGIPIIMLLCGLAMVSSIPYVHVTNRYVHGSRSFGYVVRLVLVLILAVVWFQETVAVLLTVYVLSGPVGMLRGQLRSSRGPDIPAAA